MKKNKGRKLVALLLAALIVSSSSALVYAADPNTNSPNTSNSQTYDSLSDGEYPVNLALDCFESKTTSQFADFFRVDLAKVVVKTDAESDKKEFSLKIPVDYMKKANFIGKTNTFGYSYTKYTSENGIQFSDIVSQGDYVNLKQGVAATDLGKLDEESSKFSFVHTVPLNNLDDNVYLYFNFKNSQERLALTIKDVNKEQQYEHCIPSILSFSLLSPEKELYYQDEKFSTQIEFDCAGLPSEFLYEFQVDEGDGYSEPSVRSTTPSNGRQMQTTFLGELKYNDKPDAEVGWGYVIKGREAHTLTVKARIGAKYHDGDDVYWSEYNTISVNVTKAGVNTLNSADKASVFTNSVTPRFFTSSYYMIPYDTSFSISEVTDESTVGEINGLLKDKTGRDEVDFSALDFKLLNPNGEILKEMISSKYSSWSEVTFKAFVLPSIKDFDANNMSVYRYENGELIDALMVTPLTDVDTGELGFGFYPDENGTSGIYVFAPKEYKGFDEWFSSWQAGSFFSFEAHFFDKNDKLKKDESDSFIVDNEVYSYIDAENGCTYLKLSDISGKYIENIRYKDFVSDTFKEAEIIESTVVNGEVFPTLIKIPRTSDSAYDPLKFTINGTEKEVNFGINYAGTMMPMAKKPTLSDPTITVKNADGDEVSNLTNDGTAYVSIDAPEYNQKLLYTLTADGEVVAENQPYTEPFELSAKGDEGTVYTLKAWVEAADAEAASSLGNSAEITKEISFSKKGAYAETAKNPVIGVQYQSGDSLENAKFKVVLSSETEGASIYYTTDGTEPTAESSLYTEPFTVNGLTDGKATVIKAIALKDNTNDSETVQKTVEFKTDWWDNILPYSEYTIPVKMVNFMKPDMLSMGNGAIAGDGIFKVDAKGNKTLTIPFKAINLGGIDGNVIHFWYFPDANKAREIGWDTYMLDYECEYTYNSDGTIKTVTLPVLNNDEMITCALEANVTIMGKQQTYIKPDYFSIIEDVTGKAQVNDELASPEITSVLADDKKSVTVSIAMPKTSSDTDADIFYIVSQNSDLEWDDSTAEKYDASKPIVITRDDVDADGLTNVYAVAKSGDKQSVVASKKIMLDLTIPDEPTIKKEDLADGKYNLYAEMYKLDKYDYSMSNNAINHTVQLEVKDGEYYITVQFKGLAIFNKFGYLMNLGYFDKGYTIDSYGVPQGTVIPAEVLSTQKDSDGNDVIDQYNDADHLYPELLRFKVVDGSDADYIPLQVFVPIMEAISTGTGTQEVYMKVDWSTLVKTDEDIIPEEPEKQSPAFDAVDEPTGVKAHADAGVFPEGVQMAVTPITSGDMFDKAKTALDGTSDKFTVYEIHFVDAEGNAVQPNGVVTVSYPIPSDYDSTALALYRINEDGTKTLVKGEAADGFYTVMQRSFSTYVLADISESPTDPDNTGDDDNTNPDNNGGNGDNTTPDNNSGNGDNTTPDNNSGNGGNTNPDSSDNSSAPKTGDSTGSALAAVLMMLSAAGAAVFAGKRKKETGEK